MNPRLTTCFVLLYSLLDISVLANHHRCHSSSVQFVQTSSPDGRKLTFDLVQTAIVDSIIIKRSCDDDRMLLDGQFNVTYTDASDFTGQERIYSENVTGERSHSGSVITLQLDNPVLYTGRLSFSHRHATICSTIHVLGCSAHAYSQKCDPTWCKNGGTCIGNGQCACTKGYMGLACEQDVQSMTFDDFGFLADSAGVLYTKVAAFNISGDVSFSVEDQSDQQASRRSARTLGPLTGLAHWFGHGGSLNYMPSHLSGFLHSHHHTYGHLPSHSIYSGLNNFMTGFSYSVHAKFGHHHHHSNTHYFYSTHGTLHFSHGSSLHFNNNHLHMHVHYANYYGHHHHFHLSASFKPLPNIKYQISSSFSPHLGASLFINGHNIGSLTKPNINPPAAINYPGIPKPLCFGLCGSNTGTGPNNLTTSNVAVAGANVATMAKNFLLGLLGLPMLNLLNPQQQNTATTPRTVSTRQTTTGSHGGFTLAPTTTLLPASASSVNTHVATTTPSAPVCYACANKILNTNCLTTSQCYTGEVCAVYHETNGYTHRCMSKMLCDTLQKSAKDCWKCCTGNLCNDKCVSSCSDKPQCARLQTFGYNVCNDPVASVSFCPKTCNKCSASG